MSETADDSLRATIEAAYAKTAEPVDQGVQDAPEVDTETETAADARARDERGRFAPKAQDAADPQEGQPDAASAVAAREGEPDAPAEPQAQQPPAETVAAPDHWRPADKEMLAKLPREGQEFLMRRHKEMEADYTHKTSQIAAFRRNYAPVEEMLKPYEPVMREKGVTPATLVKGWFDAEVVLANPQTAPQMIAKIIQSYRVDPAQVLQTLGYSPATGEPPPVEGQEGQRTNGHIQLPPEVQQVLQGVLQRVETFEQRQAAEQAMAQRQAASRVQSEIDSFAREAGPNGQPLRPYFREVEETMADLADLAVRKGGDVPPLQMLYEQAVYAHPVVRGRFLADQAAASEAQRVAQDRQRAEQARARANKSLRAAAPVTGSPGTGHGDHRDTGELSLKQQLERAYSEATAR